MVVDERTRALVMLALGSVFAGLHWTLAAILCMCAGCFVLGRSDR